MAIGAALLAACVWNNVMFPPTDEVTACIQNLPFNASWRDGTVSTIKALLPSYVLADILTNTGPPASIAVNLYEALDEIRRTEYNRDVDMWLAFTHLFASLHDAHTVITKPKAYSNLVYTQPFKLAVKMVGNDQKVFLGAEAVPGIFKEVGQKISSLSGLEVISLNGVSPITAVNDWATEWNQISLDGGARFNNAIKGAYVTRQIDRYDFPTEPMQYVLRNSSGFPVSIDISWRAAARAPNSTIDISVDRCTTKEKAELLTTSKGLIHQTSLLLADQQGTTQWHSSASEWVLESDTPPLSIYTSRDGTTAVMKLTSFSPDNVSDYCNNMDQAWELLEQKRVKNLIIDVLGNGGGYVCLGYDLVRLLSGATLIDAPPDKYGAPYDLHWVPELSKGLHFGDRQNPAYHELGMDSWLDPFTLSPVNLSDLVDHGSTDLRGKVTDSRYSSRFFLDCSTDEFEGVCKLRKPKISFPKEHVLVLTDGTCGSTCSTFMHKLQAEGKYAKVAGVGGIKLAPLVTSSFAGGFTSNIGSLNRLFMEEDRIQDFPTNGGLKQFAWAELYDPEYTSIPGQYAYREPDMRFDFWDFGGPLDSLYDMAKATFPVSGVVII